MYVRLLHSLLSAAAIDGQILGLSCILGAFQSPGFVSGATEPMPLTVLTQI